jgi:hypothetical protein
LIQDLQSIQEKATVSLQQAKIKQAHYYNQHRTVPPVYSPGDLVLLSRKNIKTLRTNSKLDFRHLGPFSVIKMIGENAVHLDIKSHYPKLHPVFNISLLTPYKEPTSTSFRTDTIPHPNNHTCPVAKIDWKFFEEVLAHRSRQKGSNEYLCHWKNSTPFHDRWIHLKHIPRGIRNTLIAFHRSNNSAIPLLLTGTR